MGRRGADADRGATEEVSQDALSERVGIERFECDQHDHVSFAGASTLLGKRVPPSVITPLHRRHECGRRQAVTTLLGGHICELAWERAKLPACFGELELSVANLGFAAQATYWSAFDLLGGMDRNRRRTLECRPL